MHDVRMITAPELKAMLHDGEEIAVLDAREEGDFATSHLLMASALPLSQLESHLGKRVPRRSARVVWMDAHEGFAQRAAARSAVLGYTDVSMLEGGIEAWRMAGYTVYTGMHLPSKAFAEVVEHDDETPWVSAITLQEMTQANPNLTILDSRSYEEYHANSIPGAMSCPGAELVYRITDIVKSPDEMVVVNCGGRTRSIIGAQSLINAGIPNPVVSLRDGTMAWHLAGLEVANGRQVQPPAVSEQSMAWATGAAERVARRFCIEQIDAATLAAYQADAQRTVYLLDVRTAQEFETSHLVGVRCVGGGQLVQETDRHLAVWGARVVLTDEDGVRATMTASWLAQMGWDVCVYVPSADAPRETGPYDEPVLGLDLAQPDEISAIELALELGSSRAPVVVDIAPSLVYAEGHLAGAWFATRARLESGRAELPTAHGVVVTSPDGVSAALCAAQLVVEGVSARALVGGTAAWRAAGKSWEVGMTKLATPPNDLWHTPRARDPERREAAMREYLTWETALVFQIKQDEDCRYRSFPALERSVS
jgi:rhodanese-related sulfurtransferase